MQRREGLEPLPSAEDADRFLHSMFTAWPLASHIRVSLRTIRKHIFTPSWVVLRGGKGSNGNVADLLRISQDPKLSNVWNAARPLDSIQVPSGGHPMAIRRNDVRLLFWFGLKGLSHLLR
eukprot:TRINITY_DN67168_c0_g1_i1.p1 TRINITY_DN67168_c0_g1~~TRINITY_DN67168_c0_g1_i1.p1  ORF type:complete len:120 (+),score=5.83 TRINITY_DN67168_c0_g1_i1:219-578(+)